MWLISVEFASAQTLPPNLPVFVALADDPEPELDPESEPEPDLGAKPELGAVSASSITSTTATLTADFNGVGLEYESINFLYRPQADENADWQSIDAVEDGFGHVTVQVTGLQSATKYDVYLVAKTQSGEEYSGANCYSFSTKWKLPQVSSVTVDKVTTSAAQFVAQIDPLGEGDVTYQFQYWPTNRPEDIVLVPESPGTLVEAVAQTVTQEVTDLQTSQQYKLRLVAYTPDGRQLISPAANADPIIFTTSAFPSASVIVDTDIQKAELKGTVDPHGHSNLEYRYRYWPTSLNPQGTVTCETKGVTCTAAQPFSETEATELPAQLVGNLSPATEYAIQIVVADAATHAEFPGGGEITFKTRSAPTIGVVNANVTSATAVQLVADFDPVGQSGLKVELQYQQLPDGQLQSEPLAITQPGQQVVSLNDLTAGAEYKVRLVATSRLGSEFAADYTNFKMDYEAPLIDPVLSAEVKAETHRAEFKGTIDPQGHTGLRYYFRYWSDSALMTAEPTCSQVGVICTEIEQFASSKASNIAPALVDELLPGTLYHMQLVVSDYGSSKELASSTEDFTTYPQPVMGDTLVQPSSTDQVVVTGNFDSQGQSNYELKFRYRVVGVNQWTEVPAETVGENRYRAMFAKLKYNTSYEVELLAVAPLGTVFNGATVTFTTDAGMPTILTSKVEDVATNSALFKATIDSHYRKDIYVQVKYFPAASVFADKPDCASSHVKCTERVRLDTKDGEMRTGFYAVPLLNLVENSGYLAWLVVETDTGLADVKMINFTTLPAANPVPPPVFEPPAQEQAESPSPSVSAPSPSPPVSPTPLVPASAPQAVILKNQAVVVNHGQVELQVTCRSAVGQACAGTVVLSSKQKGRRKRPISNVGKGQFHVAPGQSARVKVRLNKKVAKQLQRNALKVTATVTVNSALAKGGQSSSSTTLTIKTARQRTTKRQ